MNQKKICPRCSAPAPLDAPVCLRAGCGHQYRTNFNAPDRTQMAGQWEEPTSYAPTPYYPPSQQYVYQEPAVYYAPQPQQEQVGACAIISATFGVLGLVFFCLIGWIFGIAGLALGAVSLYRVSRNRHLTGAPIAITGVILSLIPVAFSLWMLAVWMIGAATPDRPAPMAPSPGQPSGYSIQ